MLSILLYLLILSVSAAADEPCPLAEGKRVRICPVCSDRQAGVMWRASTVGTDIREIELYFKCTDSSGTEVPLDSSCVDEPETVIAKFEGYRMITATFIVNGSWKRINVIDLYLSDGVVCAFKGRYKDEINWRIFWADIPEDSCTVNKTLDCDNNPESCNFPATCNTIGDDCECSCNTGYQGDSCAELNNGG